MRVATYNVHRAIGADGRQDPGRIGEVLRELDADLVALQEVVYHSEVAGNALERFAMAMGAEPVEGSTMLDERGHYGNAVLSRLPLEAVRRHDISVPGREPRGALEIDLRQTDIPVRLVATHLGLRPGERRAQVECLVPLFERDPAAFEILLGDLNEWFLLGRPLRRLRRVFGATPAPATFPARLPLLALDRVWVRPASAVRRIAVHRSPLARQASDHLPLVAELQVHSHGA